MQEDKSLKLAFVSNAVNWVLGGLLAAFLRGGRALLEPFSVIAVLVLMLVLQGRMHYLSLRVSTISCMWLGCART